MSAENADLKKLRERLDGVGTQLAKSLPALEKLDVNWALVPAARGPVGFLDQACTQDNQCEPNPGCHLNSSC